MLTRSYEGPKCPHCGNQLTADGPEYFDESNYTKETCNQCGKTFSVEVFTETIWTCDVIKSGGGK